MLYLTGGEEGVIHQKINIGGAIFLTPFFKNIFQKLFKRTKIKSFLFVKKFNATVFCRHISYLIFLVIKVYAKSERACKINCWKELMIIKSRNNGFVAFGAVCGFSLYWCTSKVERGRSRTSSRFVVHLNYFFFQQKKKIYYWLKICANLIITIQTKFIFKKKKLNPLAFALLEFLNKKRLIRFIF